MRYRNRKQKLSEADLEKIEYLIKEEKKSFFSIGSEFNVSGSYIGKIAKGIKG